MSPARHCMLMAGWPCCDLSAQRNCPNEVEASFAGGCGGGVCTLALARRRPILRREPHDPGISDGAGHCDDAGRRCCAQTAGRHAQVAACAKEAGYNEAQNLAYFDIVLSEISRGWLIAELAKAGLANTVIDKALDFGPGRTNPTLEEDISEAQIEAIITGFLNAKVDLDKVPQQAWEHVGAYTAATAIYWQAIGKLP